MNNCITLTKEKLVEDLIASFKEFIKNDLDELFEMNPNGLSTRKHVQDWCLVREWPLDRVLTDWREYCSDQYFYDNPLIRDVMVMVREGSLRDVKLWVASSKGHAVQF